jgi:hypothetical protein
MPNQAKTGLFPAFPLEPLDWRVALAYCFDVAMMVRLDLRSVAVEGPGSGIRWGAAVWSGTALAGAPRRPVAPTRVRDRP